MSNRIILWVVMICISGSVPAQQNLSYFINEAITNSPLLRDYQNQVRQNALDSERIRASYLPQVTGTTNNTYAPVVRGYGYDGAITNGANISALLGVNTQLVGKRNLQSQFQTLGIASGSVQNTASLSRQDLTRTIAAQYITTYGDLQQLRFSQETFTLLSKEDSVLKKLTESNVYRQSDYLTFLVTVQQQELVTKQAEIQYETDYRTLKYLCGITDTTMTNLVEPALTVSTLPYPENSIFFRQYTLDSLRIINERAVLAYSYKPKVNVFADAGYVTSMLSLPVKNFGTSFGFNVTVPIYDGKQRQLQVKKLDIAEQTRVGYKEFFSRQYKVQIAQLTKQLQSTEQLIEKINKQIKYSEGLIQVNTRLLVTGDVRIADLVIALNNYLVAKNLLTQNMVNRYQLINQINYWNR
jgi:outer membrane protein TolC